MKFWAVLGSLGCRENKTPNCHKYATFWGGFFNWAKKIKFKKKIAHKKLKKTPKKVAYS